MVIYNNMYTNYIQFLLHMHVVCYALYYYCTSIYYIFYILVIICFSTRRNKGRSKINLRECHIR